VNLKNRGKKRIGRYSFYLKNLIGSGFSSRVYRGIKDNDKSVHYAIKVIKMKDMNIGNINLLNNEIDIIQKLDHPNLVRFVDVLYTNHHCYLVM
jgi:serine/threonine protein kinase